MADNDVEVGFGADLSGLGDGFSDAIGKVKEGAQTLASSLGLGATAAVALGTAFEHLGERMMETAKEAIKESVTGFAELGDTIEHLQNSMGGSAQGWSALKVGIESVGMSTQTFEAVARRLPQILLTHFQAFKAAGVAYTDAEGHLLPVQETIANLSKHLEGFTAGAARNTEGVNLMGRSFFTMADMVELTQSRMQEAAQVAAQFGEVLSEKDVEASKEFSVQTNLLWTALKGFGLEIGRAVEPVLTDLAKTAREAAVPAFAAFKVVVEAVAALLNGLALSCNIVVNALVVVIATAVALTHALVALAHWDVKGAEAAWQEWKATAGQAMDDITAHAAKVNERMAALLKGPGKAEKEENPEDPNKNLQTTGDIAIAEASAKRKLDVQKEALREEGELNESMHKSELETDQAYWDKKIKLEQAGLAAHIDSLRSTLAETQKAVASMLPGSLEQQAAQAKEIALTGQIQVAEKQRADAYINGQRQMQDAVDKRTTANVTAEIESAKKIELTNISTQEIIVARKRALKQISDEQELAATNKLEEQKMAVQKAALEKELALYPEWTDKYHAVQLQIQQLDADTAKKREELLSKSVSDQKSQWGTLFGSMESGFSSTIESFMKGTTSLGDAMKGVFLNISNSIIKLYADIAAKQIVSQAQTVAGAQTTVAAQAATAGASGVASMAAAPYPLDLSAPAFGSSMYAAAQAYTAMPGLAVGSWNVPQDAFTKIHKGEMVVPEQFASGMRDGSMGGKQGDTHVHIHATDSESVERLFMQNGSAVVKAMQRQIRNGGMGRSFA